MNNANCLVPRISNCVLRTLIYLCNTYLVNYPNHIEEKILKNLKRETRLQYKMVMKMFIDIHILLNYIEKLCTR